VQITFAFAESRFISLGEYFTSGLIGTTQAG
jgi:hypothetical protein